MRVLDIRPQGIYVVVEFSAEQLEYLVDFLGASKCVYDSEKNPKMDKAVSYVTEEFFPNIDKVLEDVKEGKLWR